jgi:hypothetical protein
MTNITDTISITNWENCNTDSTTFSSLNIPHGESLTSLSFFISLLTNLYIMFPMGTTVTHRSLT